MLLRRSHTPDDWFEGRASSSRSRRQAAGAKVSDVGRSQVVEARKTKGPKSRIDATTNNAAMVVVVAKGKRETE